MATQPRVDGTEPVFRNIEINIDLGYYTDWILDLNGIQRTLYRKRKRCLPKVMTTYLNILSLHGDNLHDLRIG